MTAYTVKNTAGITVATINTGTIDRASTPLALIGQGISLYGPDQNNNFYRLLENFALASAPTNPVVGQDWYDATKKHMSFWDGVNWIRYASVKNNHANALAMATAADSVDLTVAASTIIFTAPSGFTYHPTGVILIPVGNPTYTAPPSFNLFVATSEDVMENTIVEAEANNKHAFFNIAGTSRFLNPGDSLSLQVSTVATGGVCAFKVRVFGYAVEL